MIYYEAWAKSDPEGLAFLIRLDAKRFFKWRAKNPTRAAQPIDTTWPQWWLLQGPTAFRTDEDRRQYKAALRAEIDATHG